jgi:hypothetical protein
MFVDIDTWVIEENINQARYKISEESLNSLDQDNEKVLLALVQAQTSLSRGIENLLKLNHRIKKEEEEGEQK